MEKSPEAFRTISEVAEELDVPKHVLRFWEGKFSQLRPLKRGGGRRYYRPEDVELLRGIRQLLYDDGYTIKGVQKILRQQGVRYVMDYNGLAAGLGDAGEPRQIPDVASEAARRAAEPSPHEMELRDEFAQASEAHELSPLKREQLLDVLRELDACRKILSTKETS